MGMATQPLSSAGKWLAHRGVPLPLTEVLGDQKCVQVCPHCQMLLLRFIAGMQTVVLRLLHSVLGTEGM